MRGAARALFQEEQGDAVRKSGGRLWLRRATPCRARHRRRRPREVKKVLTRSAFCAWNEVVVAFVRPRESFLERRTIYGRKHEHDESLEPRPRQAEPGR